MTLAKVRLAMAALGQKETRVGDLCKELGVTRLTLYRHVSPSGSCDRTVRSFLPRGSAFVECAAETAEGYAT
jgi:hypothetical protein